MQDLSENKREVLSFLRSNFIMSIAVAMDNKPSASILLYYVDDDLNFYFATHSDSYKTKILRENPLVSLAVWEHNKMMIQADGDVIELKDDEEKLKIVDQLASSAGKGPNFWPPLFRIKGEAYVVFKITPKWMRKLDLVQDTITQVDSPFTNIDLK